MLSLTDADKLMLAYIAAECSPDPSTQNGSYLALASGVGVSGCNRFPDGVACTPERLADRESKYARVVHAEESPILFAARHGYVTEGSTLYVPWYACDHCAKVIICAGVRRVVGHRYPACDAADRWRKQVEVGLGMLREAGVACEWIEDPIPGAPDIRLGGRVWSPSTLTLT